LNTDDAADIMQSFLHKKKRSDLWFRTCKGHYWSLRYDEDTAGGLMGKSSESQWKLECTYLCKEMRAGGKCHVSIPFML
jgi:hypothetical protein